MNKGTKVILNTIVIYIKIIVTMVISLVSVPLVLKALGESDYGMYNLLAGVVSMLAFLNSSMTISTQRFISVAMGTNDNSRLNEIFSVSIFIHLLLGILIVLIFEGCTFFIFDGFLNIADNRIDAAKIVYQCLVLSTFASVLSVPYSAVMNAKEDLVVFSIIYIVDSICKLILALLLINRSCDRLIMYGIGMAFISLVNTLVFRFYVKIKYKEFHFNLSSFNIHTLKDMGSFAGWNTLGSIVVIGRNQGIAIIINQFVGLVANAAYGIANQVNGVLVDFSSTFQRTLNPQLMQSEGMNNRARLHRISFMLTKSSVLVLAFLGVPLIIEMPYVLKLWLHEVPENTIILTQLILILNLIYQFSVGTISSIQAVGNVKVYFICTSSLILLNIPISIVLMRNGFPLYSTLITAIVIEIFCFIIRLLLAKHYVDLNISSYFKEVFTPLIFCVLVACVISFPFHYIIDESFMRLAVVCILYAMMYIYMAWKFLLDSEVKAAIYNFITRFITK